MENQSIIANQRLYEDICNANLAIQKAFELKYGKDIGMYNERIYGEEDYRNEAARNFERAKKEAAARKKNLRSTPLLLIPVAIGIVIFLAAVAQVLDRHFDIYLPVEVLILAIPFSLIICLLLFVKTYREKKHEIYYEAAEENERLANEKLKELEALIQYNQHYIAIIAPEFRYPIATHELARIFRLGRAATLPEAYDKLELKLHQMRVEEKLDLIIEGQRAVISLLSKIEYNTRWLDYRGDYYYDYDDF